MRRKHTAFVLGLLITLLLSTGCAENSWWVATQPAPNFDLARTIYHTTDRLVRQNPTDNLPSDRVLVATPVNLNNMDDTSTFGRLVNEYLCTRLANHGYEVVHLTVRSESIVINDEGKFLMTTDARNLSADHDAAAILVSTYLIDLKQVHLSFKLVSAADNEILAAVDHSIPKSPHLMTLLRRGQPSRRMDASVYEASYDLTQRFWWQ